MKYIIKSDIPGRLRIRYPKYVISFEIEGAVKQYFEILPFVDSVKVSYETGSILLLYKSENREELIAEASKLEVTKLVPIKTTSNAIDREKEKGLLQILLPIIGWALFRRLLLPIPIRNTVTVIRALKYVKKGLQSLSIAKIGVDVLDASAVSVSAIQGNFGTASSIMLLLNISEELEDYTFNKTKSLLSESLYTRTDKIWVENNGEQKLISMSELKLDDLAIIRTGSTIPIDGTVYEGEAVVNQSAMTGEPLGVFKKKGDSVFAGTAIEDGELKIIVKTLENDSRLNKVVEMISDSENLKASLQSKAENIADKIVPFSFLLSLAVYIFTGNATKALSVLLVDYSCAIKLATPITILSAMRDAAEHGIAVKGGKFIEAMAEADTIVFDKTGTLTEASPVLKKVVAFEGFERNEVLRLAACMEEHFPHSVARAVVKKAKEENLRHEEEHTKVEYIVAHGIATTIHGQKAVIGSHHFIFEDEKVPVTEEQNNYMDKEIGGDSAIYLAVDDVLAGFICITDPPRSEAKNTITRLRELGISNIVMLTGDSEAAAKVVAEELCIDECHAEMLPENKIKIIKEMKSKGQKVIMVGDGINDSPALAAADASVSMKDSSDIAREVADIILQGSDLEQLVKLRQISHITMERVKSNFHFIVGFNSLLLALGIGDVITPATSAVLHNASTMLITANSMKPSISKEESEDDN